MIAAALMVVPLGLASVQRCADHVASPSEKQARADETELA
jgi:hypothetical protein